MVKTIDEKVDGSIMLDIARTLKDKFYIISNAIGIRESDYRPLKPYESFGILRHQEGMKETEVYHDFLFFGFTTKKMVPKRALFLGTFYLESAKNLIMNVHGRENIPKLKELAKEICQQYNLKVETRLKKEHVDEEITLEDIGSFSL